MLIIATILALVFQNGFLSHFYQEILRSEFSVGFREFTLAKPLILWVTTSMRESKVEASWYLEDYMCFYWKNGEHAMVLVGYDEIYYFLNDPESGSTVAYRKDVVEKRFAELGRQAVYIDTK